MIKITAMLGDALSNYVNLDAKIKRMVAEEKLFGITSSIYETNHNVSGYCLTVVIYGPSHFTFEDVKSMLTKRFSEIECLAIH